MTADGDTTCQVCRSGRAVERLERAVETLNGPVGAEGDERVEQRRRRRPSGHGDANGHEQVTGLPAALLRERSQGRLEFLRFVTHLADAGNHVAGSTEPSTRGCGIPAFRDEDDG